MIMQILLGWCACGVLGFLILEARSIYISINRQDEFTKTERFKIRMKAGVQAYRDMWYMPFILIACGPVTLLLSLEAFK
jgi:hypothetical protein